MRTFESEQESIQAIITRADIPKGKKILDIGTGMGWMAASLAKNGYQTVTIESEPEFQTGARQLARRLGVEGNIEFRIESIDSLSFGQESFDGVVSYLTLHHISDKESAVRKMIELCKSGGKIVIVELTGAGLETVSQYQSGHTREPVDPSPILKQLNIDYEAFTEELTSFWVCRKNR